MSVSGSPEWNCSQLAAKSLHPCAPRFASCLHWIWQTDNCYCGTSLERGFCICFVFVFGLCLYLYLFYVWICICICFVSVFVFVFFMFVFVFVLFCIYICCVCAQLWNIDSEKTVDSHLIKLAIVEHHSLGGHTVFVFVFVHICKLYLYLYLCLYFKLYLCLFCTSCVHSIVEHHCWERSATSFKFSQCSSH